MRRERGKGEEREREPYVVIQEKQKISIDYPNYQSLREKNTNLQIYLTTQKSLPASFEKM